RTARLRRADGDYPAAAAKASRMLLGPVASLIQNKRLLIVGEGVLLYLPFAALPEPVAVPAQAAAQTPLILKHEIVTAPSASVVAVLRQETAGRKPTDKTLAVLADPVFTADDARIAPHKKTLVAATAETDAGGDATRPAGDRDGQELVRLRFSRSEAE